MGFLLSFFLSILDGTRVAPNQSQDIPCLSRTVAAMGMMVIVASTVSPFLFFRFVCFEQSILSNRTQVCTALYSSFILRRNITYGDTQLFSNVTGAYGQRQFVRGIRGGTAQGGRVRSCFEDGRRHRSSCPSGRHLDPDFPRCSRLLLYVGVQGKGENRHES